MIKLCLNCQNGLVVEVDGTTVREAFLSLAQCHEVFGEKLCGKCRSTDIMFEHRRVDDNDFFGYRCRECGAQLDLGQHKTGQTFFVKRKTKEGEWLEHNGWYHWKDRKSQQDDQGQSEQPQQQRKQYSEPNW